VNGTGRIAGPDQAALEPLQELLLALAFVGGPAVEVDQRLDLVVAGGGIRDDDPAVGVADEHDRAGQGAPWTSTIVGVAVAMVAALLS
jgi:hypothetical protein